MSSALQATALLAALTLPAAAASAAPFLNVDFNKSLSGVISPTQGGAGEASPGDSPAFSAFNVVSAPAITLPSNTYAGVTVTLAGGTTATGIPGLTFDANGNFNGSNPNPITSQDRATPVDHETGTNAGFTYGEVYRDFVFPNTSGSAMGIELSGLAASTTYTIKFYAYDQNATRPATFTNLTGGASTVLGTINNPQLVFTTATSNDVYSLSANVTTDAQGRLLIAETNPGGLPILNALQLSTVPEPASLVALVAGGVALARRRRRAAR